MVIYTREKSSSDATSAEILLAKSSISYACHIAYFHPSPQSRWTQLFSLGLVFFGALPSSGPSPFSGSLVFTANAFGWPGGYTALIPGLGGLFMRIPARRDWRLTAAADLGVLGSPNRPVSRRDARDMVSRMVHCLRLAMMKSTMLATVWLSV